VSNLPKAVIRPRFEPAIVWVAIERSTVKPAFHDTDIDTDTDTNSPDTPIHPYVRHA